MLEPADRHASGACALTERGSSTLPLGTSSGQAGLSVNTLDKHLNKVYAEVAKWYTRTLEVRMGQPVQVQFLSSAHLGRVAKVVTASV